MIDHGARDHAKWSASSTERNWQCPGALALTDGLPETTNEAADWGTCAHQIAEHCLRRGVSADSFIGTTEKGKKYEFEVDEEMADTAQQYVDYVMGRVDAALTGLEYGPVLQIETKFNLNALNLPFEAGGTCDAIVYNPGEKLLEVIDLKGGRGKIVEVTGNPQLRTYALGAMLANSKLDVDTVKVTIVQPRAPHKDGRIRSETFHVADLMEWTADLVRAARRAHDAMIARPTMNSTLWEKEFLNAGNHCTFCKAAGFCPALERKAHDAAGVWFDDMDQPRISNTPDNMDVGHLAQTLDSLDMIEAWIASVRSYAHRSAEDGVEIPGYQLVDKIGRRKWRLEGAELVQALEAKGIPHQHLWAEPTIKSPAQIEKTVGSKKKGLIDDLTEKLITGTNLVSTNKTSRPAAKPGAAKHFDILE